MTTIARQAHFLLPDDTRSSATLRYNPDAPLAVVIDFGMDSAGIQFDWTFARDILADGLTHHAGEGAVECWTDGAWYHVQLSGFHALTSARMNAVVRFDVDDVRAFLVDTEDLVPYGAEQLADFDVELSKLLIGGW